MLDNHTDSYYLHSFLKEQPDLNWRNDAMVEALFKEMAFWLEMGVDGFRLDVINLIIKDAKFRNNPWGWGGRPRPYDLQKHVYDRDQKEAHDALVTFRSWVDSFADRMLVGEILVEKPGDPTMAASYLGDGKNELHLTFDFSFTWIRWHARTWREAAQAWYAAIPDKGWPAWVFSNHDVKRAVSRFGEHVGRDRIAMLFLLTQKGTPFLYYGEELGLPDRPVAKKDLQDPLGMWYWPFHRGRDGARRPMVWDDGPQRGFSDSKPWLPPYPQEVSSCEVQKENPDSLLNLYRELIQIRNHDPVLRKGEIVWVDIYDTPHVLAYTRDTGSDRRLVLLNFSHRTVTFDAYPVQKAMDSNTLRVIFSTIKGDDSADESVETLSLQPYQGLICQGE